MRTKLWLFGTLGVFTAIVGACAEAGGTSAGGDLTEAGTQAVAVPVFLLAVDASATCGEGGTTWTDLYRDIFASGQPGSCTSSNICHGNATDEGAEDATGLQCFTQAGCRQSLLDLDLVVPANLPQSMLLSGKAPVLRTSENYFGTMPKEPSYFVMPPSCVDRITEWIDAGAAE